MNKIRWNRLWQILYPIAVYYILYNLFFSLLCIISPAEGNRLILLGAASILTLPFCCHIYKKATVVAPEKLWDKKEFPRECCYIIGIVLFGILLNIGITHTPLVEISNQYAKANQTLYEGSMGVKLLVNALCIPLLEEVVYRGIVCGQLSLWYSKRTAILISAFCFGIMHFNVVQFLYGFLVGMMISAAYIKTRKLWVAVAAHGLTNGIVILLTSILR